ncbi:MAG: hypothetical protein WC762_08805 [Methylobacter sp.]|jgi:hypothetical protein
MKWIAPITFFLITVAACITVVFVKALKPTSVGAFAFFAVWLVLPYVVMSIALILLWRKRALSVHWHVVAVLVSIGGIVFLTNVIFWHPDAQGAIAVLMTPILQGGALALLLPMASWVSRNARA